MMLKEGDISYGHFNNFSKTANIKIYELHILSNKGACECRHNVITAYIYV